MTSNSQATYAIDFYYDSYEKDFGDGFYPLVKTNNTIEPTMKETQIQFQVINNIWKQASGDMIYGLDGENGKILLNILNAKQGSVTVGTQIVNSSYITIYPKNK
jgi:hypothetical protein